MEFYSGLYYKKAENVNESLTFEGLRNEFSKVAKKFYSVQKEHEAKLKEIKASGIYADKYIKDKIAEFSNKEASIKSECVDEIKEATKKVIDKKKSAINSMLSTAPTQEQINLLQSLKMQGKSLSKAEINAILPELANNYRALKTMQSIAEGVGYTVVLPSQYDYEELSSSLDLAEKYLADRIDDIGKPIRDWSLASDCFFGQIRFNLSDEEWSVQQWEDPLYSKYAKVLDGNIQTAPTVEPVKKLTESEKQMLDRLFEGKIGEDLKVSVREASESSNIEDLIKRSEYAEYLEE